MSHTHFCDIAGILGNANPVDAFAYAKNRWRKATIVAAPSSCGRVLSIAASSPLWFTVRSVLRASCTKQMLVVPQRRTQSKKAAGDSNLFRPRSLRRSISGSPQSATASVSAAYAGTRFRRRTILSLIHIPTTAKRDGYSKRRNIGNNHDRTKKGRAESRCLLRGGWQASVRWQNRPADAGGLI